MPSSLTTVRQEGRAAVVDLRGDLAVATARELHTALRGVARRRAVRKVVLDFTHAGRIDSSGLAVLSLLTRQLRQAGKALDVTHTSAQQRAALELLPSGNDGVGWRDPVEPTSKAEGVYLRLGGWLFDLRDSLRGFVALVVDTARQLGRVITRRAHLPGGALTHHVETMGVQGIFIVALLSFLTGMTMAFQGAVQLQRFGAGVFVADMIGMSMVRELVPLMTAVIITGRTGAAIAAELGTMQVRSEIDALSTMGINPIRFLILPRFLAITIIGPALTLIGIFIGMLGGMLVASATLDLPAVTFWSRIVDRVVLLDFLHGLGKSLVFAWIIGLTACHLGMRAGGDAGSVGTATTRTVVTSV
ncbi:MAG TPA: ABC transporter permease, partial [Kofleriaceae bacterium]|nr:ABC transporter permease [Kofleriaceae bacterium]